MNTVDTLRFYNLLRLLGYGPATAWRRTTRK